MAELNKFVVERLGDDNYPTWAPKMKWMLVSKDLWEAVGDAAHEGSAGPALSACLGISMCAW